MKAQSVVEYIIAIILFIVIVIYMLNIFFDRIPEEIAKIEEQELCSEAESIANSFLDGSGEPNNWVASSPTRLGFARNNTGINYSKWATATSRGYYNITEAIGLNYTFHLSYFVYALNYTNDNAIPVASNEGTRAFIARSGNYINVSAGSNSTVASFDLTLFFPDSSSVTVGDCPVGSNLEAGETPGTTARDGGTEVTINWTITSGDDDCTTLLPSPVPNLVFIKKAILENQSDFDIYAGDFTKIKDEFGSTEYKVLDKAYCEISRKRMIHNDSNLFPAEFNIRVW